MKTKTINNLDYFEREDGTIQILRSYSSMGNLAWSEEISISKSDWYQLIDWLLQNDEVLKAKVEAKK